MIRGLRSLLVITTCDLNSKYGNLVNIVENFLNDVDFHFIFAYNLVENILSEII